MISTLRVVSHKRKKYFIDIRLKEFRQVDDPYNRVDMKSDEGDEMLMKALKEKIISIDDIQAVYFYKEL